MVKGIEKKQVDTIDNSTGVATLNAIDSITRLTPNVIMTQPYVGRGWGIRAGVELDSTCLTLDGSDGETYVLGYIPDKKFFRGQAAQEDSATRAAPKFKQLLEGEIAIQSIADSVVYLNAAGDISLNTADGTSFTISKSTDSINQISLNNTMITEGAIVSSGVVRRDIRTDQQKIEDLFLTSLIGYDFSHQETQDIIGADSQHEVAAEGETLTGVFDPSISAPSILKIPGLKDLPFADSIITDVANPAVTEYSIEVNEFSDGIASINVGTLSDSESKAGFLAPNLAGKLVLGTVVNEKGRIPRFDYTFSSPKAHGEIWKIPGVNDKQESVDFKVDPAKSINTVEPIGSTSQWVVAGIDRFNTAIAFQLVLNTRGADHKGEIPGSKPGSYWSLQVDKEGMTKWNIPSPTSLDSKEQFRAGRSLLWNMDGSLTMSVGKEESQDLGNITAKDEDTNFVNLLTPRRGRSWTADFEGSIEHRIGADSIGQSKMVEADGALAFYYGAITANEPSVVGDISTQGVESPSKSGKRAGASITGRTKGSIELDIGVNSGQTAQSVALHAQGLVQMALGQDTFKDSLKVDAAGSIKFHTVNGGHKIELISNQSTSTFRDGIRIQHGGLQQSVIQIDANGTITLRNSLANSNIIMSALGAITMINMTGTKISMSPSGDIGLGGPTAGIDISPVNGIVMRTIGGSISLDLIGNIELTSSVPPAGTRINGLFFDAKTTFVNLGAGAETSGHNIAAFGPGYIDPLTGNPCSIGGFGNIKGG